MKAEILTIGDEVLAGNIVDTNTTYLADQLWLNGILVSYHSAVRDDVGDIQKALALASKRADIVLVTGGLGPTEDDLTLKAASGFLKKKLVLSKPALKNLEAFYTKNARAITDQHRRQALIPLGAKVFPNSLGTAPGVSCQYKKTKIYFMPGVPREMKALFSGFILPDILSGLKAKTVFVSTLLKCFGAPESKLDLALKSLYTGKLEVDGVRIGFRVSYPETFIKLSAWGTTHKIAQAGLNRVKKQVLEKIGKTYYGSNQDTLESVLGALLVKSNKTLSLAESCTGGLIAHRITNVPGSSEYFLNAVVSYSNQAKTKVLGVKPATLKKHGAVSAQCVEEMALGVQKISGSDYALAVSGIAGPGGGTQQKPQGTVYIALAGPKGVESKYYHIPRDREAFKLMVSSLALNWLIMELSGRMGGY